MGALLDLSIVVGPVVVVVYALAGASLALLVAVRPGPRWVRRRWLVAAGIAFVGGAALGAGLTWLLGDALDVLGADFTLDERVWIALPFGAVAVAVASMRRATWRRIGAAALAIVVFVATGAMSVNIAFGQYPTARSALGISAYAGMALPTLADPVTRPTVAEWTAPAGMPATGAIGSVTIPATVSGFVARDAVVYLPPAALTADPPLLPVLIVMSGQPGSPDHPFTAGGLRATLDAYAAAHQGLAPIVVSPDQLGAPDRNPMCVDSPLGNSATYLTVDVVDWIHAHLPVIPTADGWGIGGLSQGGTCSIQLGAAHPEMFSAILDASGEEYPSLGDTATTIAEGFGGDAAAYAAAHPAAIMAAHAPYADMFAVFGVGSEDTRFREGVRIVYADAQAAGMTATYVEAEGDAHDAAAWSYVLGVGLGLIADHWGLDR